MSSARRLPALLVGLGVAFVLLDLARAAWSDVVRPWQYAVAFAALGVVFLLLRSRGLPSREALAYGALGLLLVLFAAVDHTRAIQSDGIHYYAFLRSALFDRDLDFANDHPLLG